MTVSIQGYALDTLDESQWKKTYASLGDGNVFYKEIFQPDRMLAENAVKVTGLTAVFNYKRDLSADITAKYKGAAFTLGNSSTPKTDSSSAPTTANAAKPNIASTPPAAAPAATTPTSTDGKLVGSSGSCSSSGAAASSGATGNSSQNVPSDGSATLHVDVSNSRQIKICVDGPFYLLAAYSNIVNGAPVGLDSTKQSVNDLIFTDATLPKSALPGTLRKTP